MRRRPAARGLTLLEVAVSTSILTALLAVTFSLIGSANDLASEQAVLADLHARARLALDRMARELRDSGPSRLSPSPIPPLGSSTLTYRRANGYSGGAIVWSEPAELAWRLSPTEVDDGLDNDRNGLVDEGQVVWTQNPSTPTAQVVLCTGVSRYALAETLAGASETANGADDNGNGLIDERGLSFDLVGRVITIRLTLAKLSGRGELLRATVSTTVLLQNP